MDGWDASGHLPGLPPGQWGKGGRTVGPGAEQAPSHRRPGEQRPAGWGHFTQKAETHLEDIKKVVLLRCHLFINMLNGRIIVVLSWSCLLINMIDVVNLSYY